ncbi:glycosyltransferase family 4 protein [Spirulina subsalsa]|uniref:glycosyltransferase family 4 protein n=1 Tax=Spirulina subsalsa TaxID=54311 RepID=UPI0002EB36E7|nr:glycosyltransferase family 1 protein [Spirulina subsalsa]
MLVNLSFLFSQPTGITTYALNIYPHLVSLNPTLLVADPIPGYRCYQIPGNLSPAAGTKGHVLRLLWTQFKLPQIYRELGSPLIFSPVPEAPVYMGCRFVVMVHDVIPLRFPSAKSRLSYYHRYCLPRVLEEAQHIICNSVATANDLTDFFGIAPQKISPIPLAYDHNHFRELNLPRRHGRPYFLYVGRQDPYKNIQRLIEAFAHLPPREEVELWLAGPTDERYTPQWQDLARELGIRDRVKFMEYVPYEKLPILFNQAIALIFPSLCEGFGLPILEAMACGTPVITSNLSALPEVAGEAALLVDPYNTQEIAGAMNAVLQDPNLRETLHQLGLLRASEFSWLKTGQQTVSVLERFV